MKCGIRLPFPSSQPRPSAAAPPDAIVNFLRGARAGQLDRRPLYVPPPSFAHLSRARSQDLLSEEEETIRGEEEGSSNLPRLFPPHLPSRRPIPDLARRRRRRFATNSARIYPTTLVLQKRHAAGSPRSLRKFRRRCDFPERYCVKLTASPTGARVTSTPAWYLYCAQKYRYRPVSRENDAPKLGRHRSAPIRLRRQ